MINIVLTKEKIWKIENNEKKWTNEESQSTDLLLAVFVKTFLFKSEIKNATWRWSEPTCR